MWKILVHASVIDVIKNINQSSEMCFWHLDRHSSHPRWNFPTVDTMNDERQILFCETFEMINCDFNWIFYFHIHFCGQTYSSVVDTRQHDWIICDNVLTCTIYNAHSTKLTLIDTFLNVWHSICVPSVNYMSSAVGGRLRSRNSQQCSVKCTENVFNGKLQSSRSSESSR